MLRFLKEKVIPLFFRFLVNKIAVDLVLEIAIPILLHHTSLLCKKF